jgi:hypothetical protein
MKMMARKSFKQPLSEEKMMMPPHLQKGFGTMISYSVRIIFVQQQMIPPHRYHYQYHRLHTHNCHHLTVHITTVHTISHMTLYTSASTIYLVPPRLARTATIYKYLVVPNSVATICFTMGVVQIVMRLLV